MQAKKIKINRNDVHIFLLLCIQSKDFHSHFVSCSFYNLCKKKENFTEMMYKISKAIVFIHIFQIYEEKKKNKLK